MDDYNNNSKCGNRITVSAYSAPFPYEHEEKQQKDDFDFTRITRALFYLDVKVKKLCEEAIIPTKANKFAAGWDVYAKQDTLIYPDAVSKVETGIAVEIPVGYELQVRPRSGLSNKGVFIANAPGTIDCDYRGEVCVLMYSMNVTYGIKKGDRIAQLVLAPVLQCSFNEVDNLSTTDRGSGGFGSTGK
jgi:dUTP pyrophosphatase